MILGSPFKIETIQTGKKFINKCQFQLIPTQDSPPDQPLKISLCQTKLQTDTAYANSIVMGSTDRTKCTLELENPAKEELYVNILFIEVSKSDSKEEVQDCKAFIKIDGLNKPDSFGFILQANSKATKTLDLSKPNKAEKNPHYKLVVEVRHFKYEEERSYALESPRITVDSKISSNDKKRKRDEETIPSEWRLFQSYSALSLEQQSKFLDIIISMKNTTPSPSMEFQELNFLSTEDMDFNLD